MYILPMYKGKEESQEVLHCKKMLHVFNYTHI